ncbi:MAG TPA: hypothetical protein VL738_38530 [Dactylosporangium sp.]|nr:hypothetical protein [Dactylosporangium sp.]
MDLIDYGAALAGDMADAQGQLVEPITGISQHSAAAFIHLASGAAGVFSEAKTANAIISRNLQDVQAFLQDVGTGLQAIQSASTVMAVAYATTDGESADSVGAVAFAFADGSAGAPKGFPTKGVSTMFDDQMARDAAAGRNTSAALAADDPSMLQYATETEVQGGYLYTFADGSKLMITTGTSGSMFISNNTTTKSIYKPGDKQPSSIVTTGESTDYSGQPTKSKTVQTAGADGKYITTTESTTQLSGGGVHVSTTTTGADGKSHTSDATVMSDKPVADGSGLGEIEKREVQYDSKGSKEGQAQSGM